jgi:hypothetical protein
VRSPWAQAPSTKNEIATTPYFSFMCTRHEYMAQPTRWATSDALTSSRQKYMIRGGHVALIAETRNESAHEHVPAEMSEVQLRVHV